MTKRFFTKRQQGMTLIEIMIALVLGVFLVAGVIQIFLSTQRTYRVQENLSRMQENGRFAMEFFSRDIREADFKQCFSDTSVGGEIFGANDAGLNSSDSITVIHKNDDCGVVVTVDTFTAVALFIQADTSGLPALFRISANQSTVALVTTAINTALAVPPSANNALVEGIENIQILYGEDTDSDSTANYFVVLGSVVDMDNVVSIRITMVVSSIDDDLASNPIPYDLNGISTTPTDNRLRRVFSSTISLRNRV